MNENLERVIAGYVKLRDAKNAMVKKQKEELDPLQTKIDFLENYLQKYLLDRNVESIRTEAGTAFLQRATSATVRDWVATLEYIVANKDWDLLEARVSKTAVKDFIEQHGSCVPGVEFSEAIVTRVRR